MVFTRSKSLRISKKLPLASLWVMVLNDFFKPLCSKYL